VRPVLPGEGGGERNGNAKMRRRGAQWQQQQRQHCCRHRRGGRAPAPLSLEKKQQSTFNVGSGDREVTEVETIQQQTKDNDKKNTTIK
jgi:hypothetical protein